MRSATSPKLPVSLATLPMEAKAVPSLPTGEGWQFEPKWDGFRCLAFRSGSAVELRSKSGKTLGRYFPDVLEMLAQLPTRRFVIDGELAIPVGDTLSFEALQLRLHPAASRVGKLAQATPAIFIAFDCLLAASGDPLLTAPLTQRRSKLERLFAEWEGRLGPRLSPYTRDRAEAQRWLKRAGGALDGVVAKRADGPYLPGERAMLKVKRLRTADCVVGGFRYGEGSREVGSLLLGLYNGEGKLDHVGFTSTIPPASRKSMTRELEALVSPPGFTGNAPGGPSRWSTERTTRWEPLKPKLVVEVCYDHVSDDRFRHGARLLRWRPDKAPRQCTFDQLEREARPGKLVSKLVEQEFQR